MTVGEQAARRPRRTVKKPFVPPDPLLEPRRRRRWRVTEVGVAIAALLLSGSAFLGNLGLYLRGSEIAVLPPREFLFYRDQGPHAADLYLAVPIAMINAASSDYGDVVTGAKLSFVSRPELSVTFPNEAYAEGVMTPLVAQGVAACPSGARCIPETGFYVIERPVKLMDVPGGASRTEYLSFPITLGHCEGHPRACAKFRDFQTSLRTLEALGPLSIRVELTFHFDGAKEVECRLPPRPADRRAIFHYLATRGWAQPACAS